MPKAAIYGLDNERERVERVDGIPLSLPRIQEILTAASSYIGRGGLLDQSSVLREDDTVGRWLSVVRRAVEELESALVTRNPEAKTVARTLEYGDLFLSELGKHEILLKGGPRNTENLTANLRQRLADVMTAKS